MGYYFGVLMHATSCPSNYLDGSVSSNVSDGFPIAAMQTGTSRGVLIPERNHGLVIK